MQDSGLVTDIATSLIFARFVERSVALMVSSEWLERSATSSNQEEEEEEQYSSEDDESADYDDDFDYFNLDELGVDPEEFYDLCPN